MTSTGNSTDKGSPTVGRVVLGLATGSHDLWRSTRSKPRAAKSEASESVRSESGNRAALATVGSAALFGTTKAATRVAS